MSLFVLKELVYFCHKMEEMLFFYTTVLGMQHLNANIAEHTGNWVELGCPAFKLCLHAAAEPDCKPRTNKNKLIFHTIKITDARQHLAAQGVPIVESKTWPSKHILEMYDPEGNCVQIAEMRSE